MDASLDPSTPSPAAAELCSTWEMIEAILEGADEVKEHGETYLPKFPAESQDEYERRKKSAPWRPEFADILRGIVAMPFSKEVVLAGTPSNEMKALAEDIDGRGNNLHVFAKGFFEGGVAYGAAGILVDFPPMPVNATRADEIAANARPYWVLVKADEIIALRTERRGARDIVTHLRLKETSTVINGFEETEVEKIRVLEPGRWQLWHEVKTQTGEKEWAIEAEGTLTLDEVPFVFFATAEREGPQYVRPPLLDLAVMQIELYQMLSDKREAYTMLGSPMLAANGMSPPGEGAAVVVTGPRAVLYAPGVEGITTGWEIIAPPAGALKEMRDDCAATIDDMRRLGLQATLPKTGNITATASGIDAARAHTAVGTMANACKDALEQAFAFTAKWLKSTESVEVNLHTDFSVGMYGAEEVKALIDMRDKGMISEETFFDEMLRRGVLGPQFDKAAEEARLVAEVPTSQDLLNALPPPIDPNANPAA